MFAKVLIANRGEIACRIARTCQRLGIPVAGIHSDADQGSVHVQEIGESYEIGGVTASESYLVIDKVIQAAQAAGADAIHPGFGFLSENPELARAAELAGIAFIGPTAEVLEQLGDKASAKKIAIGIDIPVIPGSEDASQDKEKVIELAHSIGFPILLKAAAGGGGKGIRVIESDAGLAEGIDAAMREGQSAFGDSSLLVERYLPKGRHIEVQILGDGQGNVIHLYERECSLQRRHQKVVEEAPAVNLDPALRDGMLTAAVRLGQHLNYRGLGTVEFLVCNNEFYFLEVNPRLQVEHPVTEEITGLDLIELQLSVVAGLGIPLAQESVTSNGHAVEVRLYAEDPDNNFMPCTGRISNLHFPEKGVRLETGVAQGSLITPYYDPMIAKLITYNTTRAGALADMRQALRTTVVGGVTCNLDFLAQLLSDTQVNQQAVDTGYIDRWLADRGTVSPDSDLVYAAAALWYHKERGTGHDAPACSWNSLSGWRLALNETIALDVVQYEIRADGQSYDAHIQKVQGSNNAYEVSIDGTSQSVTIDSDQSRSMVTVAGLTRTYAVATTSSGLELARHGHNVSLSFLPKLSTAAALSGSGSQVIEAPMMGKIIKLITAEGNQAKAGDVLLIMESMKMELRISAPHDGIVGKINCAESDIVERGVTLLELEPIADAPNQSKERKVS